VSDYGWLLSGGGFFTIAGLILLFMGRGEESVYYDKTLPYHTDAREFLEHWPPRVRLGAVKTGGKVSLAVGAALLIAGVVLWRWADIVALF
jgi:hypothetical protein